MSDQEAINAVIGLISDYGVGLKGETYARAMALIQDGQSARERAAMMAEQASYALRYRNGEDLPALQKACRGIVLLNQ